MIVIAAFLLGLALGWRRARALGGNGKDRAQFMAVFGVIFALAGLLVTVMIDRAT